MKYSRLKEELGINVIKGDSEELAVLTHYLQAEKVEKPSSFSEEAGVYVRSMNGHVSKDSVDAIQLKMPIEWDIPFPPPANPKFTFIDLFAGIGGFRIAMQNLGGKCVYSSEWDHQAKKTYEANFGEVPFGDITKQSNKDYIPESFDVLCAGFPCQAFSIAGKRGGFEDTRGTLFFDVAQILKKHKPKAFFLENVKGLTNHDKGKTLATILHTLRNDLGYYVPDPQILNAKDFGVPQNRERIFIVGFRDEEAWRSFEYPVPTDDSKVFEDVREDTEVSVKYYLSTQYMKTELQARLWSVGWEGNETLL
jgi:DNA (cytosine-5)-methyltransferase 1